LYEKIAFGFLEPSTPRVLRLAATAALEHFTASFAEVALTESLLDAYVHPTMRDLLKWHAAEEIEHKAVAFDVLKAVDPRYSVRMGGLAIGTAVLIGFWFLGAGMLLAQEKELSPRRLVRERIEARKRGNISMGSMARAIVDYSRPRFHPNDNDNYGLAREYLGQIGRLAS
jgi:predicted metal-dependent hydrolase